MICKLLFDDCNVSVNRDFIRSFIHGISGLCMKCKRKELNQSQSLYLSTHMNIIPIRQTKVKVKGDYSKMYDKYDISIESSSKSEP